MVDNKRTYVQLTSPRGIAKWPFLSKSDAGKTKFAPKFRVTLEIDKDVMENFKGNNGKLLIDVLDEMYNDACNQANRAKAPVNKPPYVFNEETGMYDLSVGVPAEYVDKKTRMIKDTVLNILDTKKQPFVSPDDGDIGKGSVLRVNFSAGVYNTSGNFGLSLRLNAVQVIEYVPVGGDYGFSVEESEDDTSFNVEDF